MWYVHWTLLYMSHLEMAWLLAYEYTHVAQLVPFSGHSFTFTTMFGICLCMFGICLCIFSVTDKRVQRWYSMACIISAHTYPSVLKRNFTESWEIWNVKKQNSKYENGLCFLFWSGKSLVLYVIMPSMLVSAQHLSNMETFTPVTSLCVQISKFGMLNDPSLCAFSFFFLRFCRSVYSIWARPLRQRGDN